MQSGSLAEIVRYFLKLGLLGFGGPVALVGQMERELVTERKWFTREQMREAIAVCQSLPGPLAIQVGIFLAYMRAGQKGAWAGGWAFIAPNFAIVTALGLLYVHYGELKPMTAIFYGVSPAVIALILHSCYRLAKLGMEDKLQWVLAAVCFVITVVVRAEVAFLFMGAGIVGALIYGGARTGNESTPSGPSTSQEPPTPQGPTAKQGVSAGLVVSTASVANATTLSKLLLFFLKAGALTFGSGLVIVPFLQQGVVQQYGWLNERDFLVAVAVGMVSPGPVVITATFVGALVAGFWGALAATLGIFLPSLVLVLLVAPILARHRSNKRVQGFIKGAYGAAIGTILGACVLLGRIAIGDVFTALVAVAALAALFRWRISNPLLMALTAVAGLIAFPLLHPTWRMLK